MIRYDRLGKSGYQSWGAVAGQDQGFASDGSVGDQVVAVVGWVVVCSRIAKSSMSNTSGRVQSVCSHFGNLVDES